jgi:hypothetical protein
LSIIEKIFKIRYEVAKLSAGLIDISEASSDSNIQGARENRQIYVGPLAEIHDSVITNRAKETSAGEVLDQVTAR